MAKIVDNTIHLDEGDTALVLTNDKQFQIVAPNADERLKNLAETVTKYLGMLGYKKKEES